VQLRGDAVSRPPRKLREWQRRLGLQDWDVVCQAVSTWQVTNVMRRRARPNELVGVVPDRARRTATIVHTRRLREDDIVHELYHVKYPHLPELGVRFLTWWRLRGRRCRPPSTRR